MDSWKKNQFCLSATNSIDYRDTFRFGKVSFNLDWLNLSYLCSTWQEWVKIKPVRKKLKSPKKNYAFVGRFKDFRASKCQILSILILIIFIYYHITYIECTVYIWETSICFIIKNTKRAGLFNHIFIKH